MTYSYDALGHLGSVYIGDGRPRTVSFVTDASGTILQRDEADQLSSGDPRQLYYYFDGIRVGDLSNDGTSETDYAASLQAHLTAAPAGPFRPGLPYPDFDQSFDPINGLTYDAAASRYTVQAGDTLASIAQGVWGDSSLWYMIADANGLDGSETLAAGRDLIIPNKVHNLHNTSDVYRVYDPNDAIGNTSPTAPKPTPASSHHHGGCGVFGQILSVVIAVAVSYFLPPVGAALGPVLGPAAEAAAVSVISQGIDVAVGIQDKFSFKGVAEAALTAGLGKVDPFGGGLIGGAFTNAAVQGIELATGLKDRFSFGDVAAAAVSSGVIGARGELGQANLGARFVTGAAAALAGAAARSVVTGTDFGDNILQVLPSVIGQTVGGALGREIARWGAPSPTIAADTRGLLDDDGLAGGAAAANTPVADATTGGNSATWLAQGQVNEAALDRAGEQAFGGAGDGLLSGGPIWTNPISGAPILATTDKQYLDLGQAFHDQQNITSLNLAQIIKTGSGYGNYDDLMTRFAATEQNLVRLDSLAIRAQNQLGLVVASTALAGAGATAFGLAGGALEIGSGGLGETVLYNVLGDGLTAGVSGMPMRSALGQQNTTGSFLTDAALGAGGGAVLRGVVGGTSALFNRGGVADSGGVDLALKYRPGWSLSQQADAAAKVQILNDADTVVLQTTRGGTSASVRYRSAGGQIPAGNDIDHMVDLQLGGSHTIANMWPLNSSVNRSLGAQIQQQIKNLPPGTMINRVTIGHR